MDFSNEEFLLLNDLLSDLFQKRLRDEKTISKKEQLLYYKIMMKAVQDKSKLEKISH